MLSKMKTRTAALIVAALAIATLTGCSSTSAKPQVDAAVLNKTVAGLTLGASADLATASVVVPSGYTRAQVTATSHVTGLSSTTVSQVIGRTKINGSTSSGAITRGPVGSLVESVDTYAVVVGGLKPGVDHVTVTVNGSAVACDAGDGTAQLSASIIWLR